MNSSSRHPPLYTPPPLTSEDQAVLSEIHQMRSDLRSALRMPRRWEGELRRTALARNIQGSNSIEGYVVTEDDAAAAIDDEEPYSAGQRTFLEIRGYRLALSYVLAMSEAGDAGWDTTQMRALHFMMLSHDLPKSPGRYRRGPVYVNDARAHKVVYTAPEAAQVPGLMAALAESLQARADLDPVVRSAMAHLNLVMIHPFRDGNGRMARALATLVLGRSDTGPPELASIEEWLGANTEDYYSVLAQTGHGSWRPRGDARLWLAFILRAHHMQAQTVARRVTEAAQTFAELEALAARNGLPDRTMDAMYEAVLGYRTRRSAYMKRAGVSEQSATRDLMALSAAGILTAQGSGRGRHYLAGPALREIALRRRNARTPIRDPCPWMRTELDTLRRRARQGELQFDWGGQARRPGALFSP